MSSSKKRGSVSGDAFALLMGSTNKKKPSSRKHGTRFVPCPAGCGQSLLEKDVNTHLDQCLVISGGEEEEDSDAMVRRVTQPEQQPSLLVNSGSCIVVSQSTPNAEDSSQKISGRPSSLSRLRQVLSESLPQSSFGSVHAEGTPAAEVSGGATGRLSAERSTSSQQIERTKKS